jgi:small-conductance mechanosensitive channel
VCCSILSQLRRLGWIVKDVDLFTTTVVFTNTNERATVSNGSIASSRIINMARSKKAILSITNKFSTVVQFNKIQIFEEALRKFVRDRPREWASFIAFRATAVMSDLGYIGT